MMNRRGFTLIDSLLALMIVSTGITFYLTTFKNVNEQLIASRQRMEQSRERYENALKTNHKR